MRHIAAALLVVLMASTALAQDDKAGARRYVRLHDRNDKAIADYTESIRLDPKNAGYHTLRARAWIEKGDYVKAIADCTEAIRLNPRHFLAFNARGLAWSEKGEYGKAIADYNMVIKLNPRTAKPYNNIAFLRATCPNAKYRNGKKAIEHAKKACEITGYKEAAYTSTLAAAYAEAGDFTKAVEQQKKAMELADEEYKPEHRSRLELYKQGKPYREEEKWPKTAEDYFHCGILRFTWGKADLDGAIEEFDEAIRLNPKYVSAYLLRGDMWSFKEEYDRAIADYTEAIRLDPKNADGHRKRGQTWLTKKEYGKAIADFNEVIRLDPKDASTYVDMAEIHATSPNAKYRDGKKAIEYAKRACDICGRDSSYYLDILAAAYAEAGDFPNAVKSQNRAIELVSDKSEYYSRLKLYKQGKPYRDEVKK